MKQLFVRRFLPVVGLVLVCSAFFSFSRGFSLFRDREETLSYPALPADEEVVPLVILGGGVGGLTAAIYSCQAQLPTLVIEGGKPGGALAQSHAVRNWPGVVEAPGRDIVEAMRRHAVAVGATFQQERVVSVDFTQWPRLVTTASLAAPEQTRTIKALSVIIATGAEPNLLGIPGEQALWGRGVSNCAVCDGAFFKDKRVVVIGGGDAAVEEASYLADVAREVLVVLRSGSFRAKDAKARDRLLARANVRVRYNTVAQAVLGGQDGVQGLRLLDKTTKQESVYATDGVFLAIGSRPNTILFKGHVTLDDQGFIALTKHQASSVPGVFATGDVCDHEFVQAVTAAGDGCRAALQAVQFLKRVGYVAQQTQARGTVHRTQQVVHDVVELKSKQDLETIVFASKLPVVLDFFATWCPPCRMMAPIFDGLAKKYGSACRFAKMNVDNSQRVDPDGTLFPRLGAKGVQGIPTFLLIRDGNEVSRVVGADAAGLEAAVKKVAGEA